MVKLLIYPFFPRNQVLHGAKRWFLMPPDGPYDMHSFNANQSVR